MTDKTTAPNAAEAERFTEPTGRVFSEKEIAGLLHGLRLTRAMVNTLEDSIERIWLEGMAVPEDKKIVTP